MSGASWSKFLNDNSDEGAPISAGEHQPAARATIGRLNETELELLTGLVRGESPRTLARTLGRHLAEIDVLRARVMEKLNAASTADAVRVGLLAGIDE